MSETIKCLMRVLFVDIRKRIAISLEAIYKTVMYHEITHDFLKKYTIL